MARDFNGTTDRIDYANVANLTGAAFTLSCWLWLDVVNVTSYIFCNHNSGDAAFGAVFLANSSTLQFIRDGATDLALRTNNATISAGAWFHALMTHDGVMTTAASAHIYKAGAELGYQTTTNGATEVAHTGSWSLGGRIFDDTRCLNGRMAEFGLWNRVLSASEIAMLALGASPLFIRSGLLFYPDLIRDTGSRVSAPATTVDGTAVIEHPRIFYPG